MSSVTFSLTFPSSFRFSFRKGALLTFSVTFVPKAGCSSLLSDGRLGAATTVEGSVESTALRMTYTVHHGSCLCLCRSRQKVRVLFVFLQEAHTCGRGCGRGYQYKVHKWRKKFNFDSPGVLGSNSFFTQYGCHWTIRTVNGLST